METTTTAAGSMTRLREMVRTNISWDQNILETGHRINSTDLALKHGLMVRALMGLMNMEASTVQEFSNGPTVHPMSEHST